MLKKGDDDSEGKLAKAQKTVDTAHASLEKTRKEMGTAYLKYLESLSDVNARATCPRCSGTSSRIHVEQGHNEMHSWENNVSHTLLKKAMASCTRRLSNTTRPIPMTAVNSAPIAHFVMDLESLRI